MSKVTMIGCDLHDRWMVLKIAVGAEKPSKKSFLTANVAEMIVWLKEFAARHETSRTVFAYEASGLGFGLHDELTVAGIECHVLAPTHLPHTSRRRKNKTDEKDAEMILDELRAHILAGRSLPAVWIPTPQTRDDREGVRMRLELGAQRSQIKSQIRSLAKRSKLTLPTWFTKSGNWSKRSMQWLRDVASGEEGGLGVGTRSALNCLIHIYEEYTKQLKELDQVVENLSKTEPYGKAFRKLKLLQGIGSLTAMVFLTEMGDLTRFANRRQVGSYLGLVPAAFESGERNDRKGNITRHGPSRIRHVLCQAAWAAIRCSGHWKATYERIKRGTSKRSKTALVAIMRKLGIQMWRTALCETTGKLLDAIDRKKVRRATDAACTSLIAPT